jgi:hypothetical protein
MDEKSECETVAKKNSGVLYGAGARWIFSGGDHYGMLMIALDAARQLAGPRRLSNFLSKLARRFQAEADAAEGSTTQ